VPLTLYAGKYGHHFTRKIMGINPALSADRADGDTVTLQRQTLEQPKSPSFVPQEKNLRRESKRPFENYLNLGASRRHFGPEPTIKSPPAAKFLEWT
jgi:hypothetical protein